MLWSLGIKISKPAKLYGDNAGVVLSGSRPDVRLKKKHMAMCYHKTCECVAAGILEVWWVDTKINLADQLTKPFSSM